MQRSDTHALKNLQTIKNPIQILREEGGYTQELLATVAECSRVLVVHAEQGLVPSVPKGLLKLLDDGTLENRYKWWLTDTRVKNYPYLEGGITRFLQPGCSGYGNWEVFRKSISTSGVGFCKLYCIHPQILATFEGVEGRTEFTRGIRGILIDAGISLEVLTNMESAMFRRSKGENNGN